MKKGADLVDSFFAVRARNMDILMILFYGMENSVFISCFMQRIFFFCCNRARIILSFHRVEKSAINEMPL